MNFDQPLEWLKSSRCSGGSCVEVAQNSGSYLIRDAKHPDVVLRFTPDEWFAFVEAAKADEFSFRN